METAGAIIEDILIFIGAFAVLLIALLVIISFTPKNSSWRLRLAALAYRVAATIAAGVVAIPLEPIPGIDVVYDLVAPILLFYYWYTLFRHHPASDASRDRLPRR